MLSSRPQRPRRRGREIGYPARKNCPPRSTRRLDRGPLPPSTRRDRPRRIRPRRRRNGPAPPAPPNAAGSDRPAPSLGRDRGPAASGRHSRNDGDARGGEEPSGPGRRPAIGRHLRDPAAEFQWPMAKDAARIREGRIGPAGGEEVGGARKGERQRRPGNDNYERGRPSPSAPKTGDHAIMQPSIDAIRAPKMGRCLFVHLKRSSRSSTEILTWKENPSGKGI